MKIHWSPVEAECLRDLRPRVPDRGQVAIDAALAEIQRLTLAVDEWRQRAQRQYDENVALIVEMALREQRR